RSLLFRAVFGVSDVTDADRRAANGLDDQIVERARVNDSAHRPQSQFAPPVVHVASGHVGVLAHDGVTHVGDRNAVSREPVGVGPDVDRTGYSADDRNLAHAVRPFELFSDDVVGQLTQLAN